MYMQLRLQRQQVSQVADHYLVCFPGKAARKCPWCHLPQVDAYRLCRGLRPLGCGRGAQRQGWHAGGRQQESALHRAVLNTICVVAFLAAVASGAPEGACCRLIVLVAVTLPSCLLWGRLKIFPTPTIGATFSCCGSHCMRLDLRCYVWGGGGAHAAPVDFMYSHDRPGDLVFCQNRSQPPRAAWL